MPKQDFDEATPPHEPGQFIEERIGQSATSLAFERLNVTSPSSSGLVVEMSTQR